MEDNDKLQPDYNTSKQDPIKGVKITFSRIEAVYSFIAMVLGFCFIRFVFWNVTGAFTTLFFISTTLLCLFYLKKNHCKLYKYHTMQLALLLIFSMVYSLTANGFIKFLNTLFLLMLGAYWVYCVGRENKKIERFFIFELFNGMFVVPLAGFDKAPRAINTSTKQSKLSNNIKMIVLGLVITFPVTLVVALLLISADSGVEKMMDALFNNMFKDAFEIVIQFIIGIPVAFYIFGMLYSNVRKEYKRVKTEEQCEQELQKLRISPNMVMYAAVTPVCILYIMFFVSQLQYFVSAFNGILPEGFSYADYARRGFFELFVISLINLLILLCINFLSKQAAEHKPIMLKIYSSTIAVFTILIIATALSKMLMYISKYGLTQLRIYVSWFMVLLAAMFVLIIIKQFQFKFNFNKYAVAIFVMLFGILCFSNIDGQIAKYNIKMHNAGVLENLDVYTLCNLSDDALVYVVESGIDTQNYIKDKLEVYKHNSYLTYNLSSYRLKLLLESNKTE